MKPTTARRRKQATEAPAMERVRLAREHEHLGKKEPAGTEISVHPEIARWLRAVGVVATSNKTKD